MLTVLSSILLSSRHSDDSHEVFTNGNLPQFIVERKIQIDATPIAERFYVPKSIRDESIPLKIRDFTVAPKIFDRFKLGVPIKPTLLNEFEATNAGAVKRYRHLYEPAFLAVDRKGYICDISWISYNGADNDIALQSFLNRTQEVVKQLGNPDGVIKFTSNKSISYQCSWFTDNNRIYVELFEMFAGTNKTILSLSRKPE